MCCLWTFNLSEATKICNSFHSKDSTSSSTNQHDSFDACIWKKNAKWGWFQSGQDRCAFFEAKCPHPPSDTEQHSKNEVEVANGNLHFLIFRMLPLPQHNIINFDFRTGQEFKNMDSHQFGADKSHSNISVCVQLFNVRRGLRVTGVSSRLNPN